MRYKRAKLIAFGVLFLPVSYIIGYLENFFNLPSILNYIKYYDELFVLTCVVYRVMITHQSLEKNSHKIFVLILAIYFIGIISNIYSQIITLLSPIIIDLVTMCKQFLVFVFLRGILNGDEREKFVSILLPFAKGLILLTFILSIISQFYELGMTSNERFGIKAFHFIYGNPSAMGISVIASLLIVSLSKTSKKIIYYLVLSFVVLFLTTKGIMFSFITFSSFMFLILRKTHLKMWHFAIIIPLLIVTSLYQIDQYFFDLYSPRIQFLSTSNLIANEYKPFGSGFATFGGEQAKQFYSPLYVKYGFFHIYGMDEEKGFFLNDNYIAMILAQTGYVGLFIFLLILCILFSDINKDKRYPYRIFSMSTLLMLYVSSIGSGIIKSTNGVLIFALLSLLHTPGCHISSSFPTRRLRSSNRSSGSFRTHPSIIANSTAP